MTSTGIQTVSHDLLAVMARILRPKQLYAIGGIIIALRSSWLGEPQADLISKGYAVGLLWLILEGLGG